MISENKSREDSPRLRWTGVLVAICVSVGFSGCKKAKDSTTDHESSKTTTDVIGDLGGMKVRIPKALAEYVEYDSDPRFGEEVGPTPERTFESELRGFGMTLHYPDMKGLETLELRSDFKAHELDPNDPWVSVIVNAGEFYPSMGSKANEGLAKKLWEKSEFWFANYAPAPELDIAGLTAYVVSGLDPKTGRPGRESDTTDDVFIEKTPSGGIATFISCGKQKVRNGIARCRIFFGLEPKANASISVTFNKPLLSKWREIKRLTTQRILAFETQS